MVKQASLTIVLRNLLLFLEVEDILKTKSRELSYIHSQLISQSLKYKSINQHELWCSGWSCFTLNLGMEKTLLGALPPKWGPTQRESGLFGLQCGYQKPDGKPKKKKKSIWQKYKEGCVQYTLVVAPSPNLAHSGSFSAPSCRFYSLESYDKV